MSECTGKQVVETIPEPEKDNEPEPEKEPDDNDTDGEQENLDPDAGKSEQQIISEITGQQYLFGDEDF